MSFIEFPYNKNAPNNATAFINGTFNVMCARNTLKTYISDILGYNDLTIMNAHFAYSIIAEIVVLYIVRLSAKYNVKNNTSKEDVYIITLENLFRSIRESNEYGSEIKLIDSYKPTAMNYIMTFFDDEHVLTAFIETKVFENNTNIKINKDALNFVCYILSNILCNLTRIACLFSKYANKQYSNKKL